MPIKILSVDDEPDMEMLITQRFRRQIRDKSFEFIFATLIAGILAIPATFLVTRYLLVGRESRAA